jgi:hypothetical protein
MNTAPVEPGRIGWSLKLAPRSVVAPDNLNGQGQKPLSQRIPCVRVIPDPVQDVGGFVRNRFSQDLIVGG